MPENPIKAMESKLAVISVIGIPFKNSGISELSRRSLTPAKITIARVNPTPAKVPYNKDFKKLAETAENFVILTMATPKTAQFVVIKGRYIPSDL